MSRGFELRVCPKHSWASTNSPCPHCWDALIVDPRDAEITRLRAQLAMYLRKWQETRDELARVRVAYKATLDTMAARAARAKEDE
jgi:hypothetical protein